MTDWLLFPMHLLDLILEKLESSKDYLQFGAVCVSWYNAMKFNQIKHITNTSRQHQVPILLVPGQEENTLNVYDALQNKLLGLKVMLPHIKRFSGSSEGWLITVNRDYTVNLYKPYFMAKHENSCEYTSLCLKLPELFPRYPDEEVDFPFPLWDHHVHKGIITADPLKDPNKCTVLTIFGEYYELAFIRYAKDKTWTKIVSEYPQFHDMLYYKNQVFAITSAGILVSFNVTNSGNLIPTFIAPKISPRHIKRRPYSYRLYIVESNGELLQVFRYLNWQNNTRFTKMFDVFKLESDKPKPNWVRVENLGDVSLFLGDNSSIAVSTLNFIGCQPNCIYFTHDEDNIEGGLISSIQDLGIFEVKSNRFKMHFNMDSFALKKMLRQPPIWVVPTIDLY